ncbi:hypothetical protein NQ315_000406 [Exocentrus adspersus]|uniref:Protein sleepless n=1 Tax=Exocentrus adspersus TaxID=1586481 RepID=A0AAV8VLR4_9CUCU|nr:hypothetical protein NQ315_000406 [Exocentrus adspersus]
MKAPLTVLVLFACVLSLNIGNALRCFSCSSTTGNKADCEVKANNETTRIITCQNKNINCVTLIINKNITRGCGIRDVCNPYLNATGFRSCYTCVTDLCNGSTAAPSTRAALGLIIIAALVTVGKNVHL